MYKIVYEPHQHPHIVKNPFRCNGKRVLLNEHLNEPTCFGSKSRELYASWTSLLGIQAAPLGPLDRQHFSLHLSSLPFLLPVLPSIHHKVSPNCLLLLQVENVIWGWWMECQNCELKQRQFYCENCLRQQSVSSIGTFQSCLSSCLKTHFVLACFPIVCKPSTLRRTEMLTSPLRRNLSVRS